MLRVLIYQQIIPHYRSSIFDLLGEKYDLTVAYTGDTVCPGKNYKVQKVHSHRIPKIGYFHDTKLISLLRNSDVVIGMLGPGCIDIDNSKLINNKIKIIKWGIGVSASYDTPFDSIDMTKKFLKIINRSDAVIFYSDYPRNKYSKAGIPLEKMFVANNTVSVDPIDIRTNKDSILFIGSLYKQKRVDLLIDSYYKALQDRPNLPSLIIIGDGDQKGILMDKVKQLGVDHKIFFLGAVNDDSVLRKYFSNALACISPNQAGLSVLKSMGYGVPYITAKGAITGGEIFNIVNDETGVLLDDLNCMDRILIDINDNTEKYILMGENAKNYYLRERTPQQMVKGFIDAIEFVMK